MAAQPECEEKAMETTDKNDKEILEVAFTIKSAMERQLMVEQDLKLHME